MKAVLPWLVVIALCAVLAWQVQTNFHKTDELIQLRPIKELLASAQSELEQSESARTSMETELKQLKTDNAELLRLRNDIRTLRLQNEQLSKQVATTETDLRTAQNQARNVQSAAALAQAQTQTAQQQQAAAMEAFRKRYGLPPAGEATPEQTAVLVCANNLRQIDGAKQQWALENNRPVGSMPTVADVTRYLKDNVMPTCPAGGSYTVNAVGTAPGCSVVPHALPR